MANRRFREGGLLNFAQLKRRVWPVPFERPKGLDFNGFRRRQGVFKLNIKISYCAVHLGVTQQQLNSTQIAHPLRFPVPQARVLGGGSSVNVMIHMRGQAQDYDDWADLHGCTHWRYADVLPVFKRQEANQQINDAFHGLSGRLVVGGPASPHPVSKLLIDATHSAGVPYTNDFNGAKQDGVGWYQVTAANGQRQSAAHCFLKPEIARESLTILTGHSAERIRFEGRCAVAIEAKDAAGQDVLINAAKQIVLTAGSFQTPKLLMLSGIGPRDELERHGIDIVHEADEVRRNYQDHVGTPVTRRLTKPLGLQGDDKGLSALRHGIDYFLFRRGLLTSNLLEVPAMLWCVPTYARHRRLNDRSGGIGACRSRIPLMPKVDAVNTSMGGRGINACEHALLRGAARPEAVPMVTVSDAKQIRTISVLHHRGDLQSGHPL